MNVSKPEGAQREPNHHGGDKEDSQSLKQGAHVVQPSLWEQGYAEGVFQELARDEKKDEDLPEGQEGASMPWMSTERSPFKQHAKHHHDPEEMSRIMDRARQLPRESYISNSIILVNQERGRRVVAPLTRSNELDEMARAHAQKMAAAGHRLHSDPEVMHVPDSTIVGENVAKGSTPKEIHKNMMQTASDRNNILDRRYSRMGMGTARSPSDGLLYVCLLFCG